MTDPVRYWGSFCPIENMNTENADNINNTLFMILIVLDYNNNDNKIPKINHKK